MPPKPPLDPKKRQHRMILIGAAAAAGLVLLLYLRGRSSASTSSSPADAQTLAQQAASQQAATDQAMYGSSLPYYYGSGAGGGGSIGGGIGGGGFDPSLLTPSNATASSPAFTPADLVSILQSLPQPAQPAPVTISTNPTPGPSPGTPQANSGSRGNTFTLGQLGQQKWSAPGAPHLSGGEVPAPFGHNAPPARAGYTVRGLGGGYWAYVPKNTSHR